MENFDTFWAVGESLRVRDAKLLIGFLQKNVCNMELNLPAPAELPHLSPKGNWVAPSTMVPWNPDVEI